jgi:NADPH:quinone reductase-like Zn-dependent oxidoreductase
MIAIRLYSRRDSGGIVAEMAPTPQPGEGEVLIRVHAVASSLANFPGFRPG